MSHVECDDCPRTLGCWPRCENAALCERDAAADHGQHALDLRNPRAELERELHRLVAKAAMAGFIIEVHLQPELPLAMGNYRMVGSVRPARERS